MFKRFLFPFVMFLAGCAASSVRDTPTRAQLSPAPLPPMKSFSAARPSAPVRSNANIAADFLALHFELESGRELPIFTRFDQPITLRVTGAPPESLQSDLSQLLDRLRREAGINIRQVSDSSANITIEAVSREEIRRALPHAACFVVPNVASLAEFRSKRRKPETNWALLRERRQLGIFLPNDVSPQEVRDCLHEELAQAIGPLNDLYRLPDSVFNDDNVHTVLTGFDMLILRASYDPALRNGMTRDEVAAALPGILARQNPRGVRVAERPISKTPRSWIDATQTALGPGATQRQRHRAANDAARIAQQQGWTDHRRAFSHYILGRMVQADDAETAQQHYRSALYYLSQTPGTDLQTAYVITQTAAYALANGQPQEARKQIGPQLQVAQRAENAALLSTLMLLDAEALELQGQRDKAEDVRLDSLGWARYGFGSDWAVRARMQEVAALNPRQELGG
ncbi:MAG: DUF2927 domain-containing protein [Paracoccaceae bacterium]